MKALSKIRSVGVDSNIFIYYFEENPQFGKAAKEIIDALTTQALNAVTSIIAVSEILSKQALPKKIANEIEDSFFEIPNLAILDVNRKIAVEAARIRRKYGFRLPDSIQLATAKLARAQAFISNDSRLKKFPELKIILLTQLSN